MEILMSVNGKYADMIFSGEKTIELRNSAPTLNNSDITVYLFDTDLKSVTGRMDVIDIFEVVEINDSLLNSSCMTASEIEEYMGNGKLYAWIIGNADYFEEDWLRLKDLGAKRAPQSWQYIRR